MNWIPVSKGPPPMQESGDSAGYSIKVLVWLASGKFSKGYYQWVDVPRGYPGPGWYWGCDSGRYMGWEPDDRVTHYTYIKAPKS